MESLKSLLVPLIFIFGISGAVLIISALGNRVLFKMGARNIPRRPANTVLILLGLMLAAMIFSASFATGDTLTYSIRNLAVDYLGETDIMVMREGADFGGIGGHSLESGESTSYFDLGQLKTVDDALAELKGEGIVAGVAPAIIETVPAVAPSKLNEPSVTLLGFDSRYMSGFTPLQDEKGDMLSLDELAERGDDYIYINTGLAEALEADAGDTIDIFLSAKGASLTVAGIYETGGRPSMFSFDSDATAVMTLVQLQDLRGSKDINYILITNQGGAVVGASHTDAVMEVLEPALEETGLKAEPIKKEVLDEADERGAAFSTMFLVMGSFSMIAGILLIFLIFVMLAAERKQELGIARAIGTQRGHIVRLFTFEGVLYALVASAVGSGLGLVITWGGMAILDAAFEDMGFRIVFDYTSSGVAISYMAGVIFTLLVVVVSARRVSRLNIICAIRDIPEPPDFHEESSWTLFKRAFRVFTINPGRLIQITGLRLKLLVRLIPFISPIFGLLLVIIGIQQEQWASYSLGSSLIIIGLCLLARKWPVHLPDRPAFTLAGIGLLIFWLSPTEWHPKGEEMGAGFEMFILTGVMLVMAAVWVVMYNSDLLLKALMAAFGRLSSFTPMIKTAVSYPMASRFRTGMAMAMFALIIFTLVFMSAAVASIQGMLEDTDRLTGGFDIRAEINYNNPIPDMEAALVNADGVAPDDFEAIGAFSIIPAKMRDASGLPGDGALNLGKDLEVYGDGKAPEEEWVDLILMGANAEYTENVNYDFEITVAEYSSGEEVWQALNNDPSLAIVSSAIVPTQYTQMGDNGIGLVVGEGEFVIVDEFIPDDIFIEVKNSFTGETDKLQVIGVIDAMSSLYAGLITTSQDTVDRIWGRPAAPTAYRFKVTPENTDRIPEIARTLEKSFAENGMNTEVMEEEVKSIMDLQEMVFNLMMAFMALGLIVGIAALGVIAARSVVERRHQVGMLRAIGFRQWMIQFTFLLESSFVALLGIGIGVGLGAGTALLFMDDAEVEGIKAIVPWGRVGLIVVIAYVASLFTTFVPAYRAARIYPAEALRYE
ncbi:MAG: FtsX-like permease family protein [Dehalococcoidia bacterium]